MEERMIRLESKVDDLSKEVKERLESLEDKVEVMNGTLNNIFNIVSSNKKISEAQSKVYRDLHVSYLQASMEIKEAQG